MSEIYDTDLEQVLERVMGDAPARERSFAAALDTHTWRVLLDLGLVGVETRHGGRFTDGVAVARAAARHGVTVPVAEHDLAAWLGAQTDHPTTDGIVSAALLAPTTAPDAEVVLAPGADRVLVVVEDRLHDLDVATLGGGRHDTAGRRVVTPAELPDPSPACLDPAVVREFELRHALVRAAQIDAALYGAVAVAIRHSAEREQFGRPVASFQAVQALVVDSAAEAALLSAAVEAALVVVEEDGWTDPRTEPRVLTARAVAARAAIEVARCTHQVLGAMGTTLEHPLQTLTRPAMAWSLEGGPAVTWERRLGRLVAAAPGDLWRTLVD